MNIVRWLKVVESFIKYFPYAVVEHWKRSRKEVLLIEALGTTEGRRMLAEALANPIRNSLYKGNGKKYKKEKS
jgi:hypothetical protein